MDIITESVRVYLERVWGYKDKCIISNVNPDDKNLLEQLRALQERCIDFYHLQESQDSHIVIIWRRKDWEMEYTKHLQDKEKSERRIKEWDEMKEQVLYMTGLIIKFFGPELGPDIAPKLAEKVVKEKNKASALMFNADMNKLGW